MLLKFNFTADLKKTNKNIYPNSFEASERLE